MPQTCSRARKVETFLPPFVNNAYSERRPRTYLFWLRNFLNVLKEKIAARPPCTFALSLPRFLSLSLSLSLARSLARSASLSHCLCRSLSRSLPISLLGAPPSEAVVEQDLAKFTFIDSLVTSHAVPPLEEQMNILFRAGSVPQEVRYPSDGEGGIFDPQQVIGPYLQAEAGAFWATRPVKDGALPL